MPIYDDDFSYEEKQTVKTFEEQINYIFKQSTLPVHVPGIDIHLTDDEIIYNAKKKISTKFEKYDCKITQFDYQCINFVVREGKIYIIKAYHDSIT